MYVKKMVLKFKIKMFRTYILSFLCTSGSSIGIILDISLNLDNLEGSLNLEVLRWFQLIKVLHFECLGLTDLLVEDIDISQGRAETETKQ